MIEKCDETYSACQSKTTHFLGIEQMVEKNLSLETEQNLVDVMEDRVCNLQGTRAVAEYLICRLTNFEYAFAAVQLRRACRMRIELCVLHKAVYRPWMDLDESE